MTPGAERKVYQLSGICAFLATASLIVPRFVPNPEGGFAAGASAILTLFIMLGATLLVSLFLLGLTVRRYRSLSMAAKFAGIAPCIVLTATLLWLFWFLGY